MSIIDMQARGLKVVRRPEAIAGAHAQEVADLTAYAKRRIAEIRAGAERARAWRATTIANCRSTTSCSRWRTRSPMR